MQLSGCGGFEGNGNKAKGRIEIYNVSLIASCSSLDEFNLMRKKENVCVSRKVSQQVCEKEIECHVDLMICDFPENHPGVMRASLARNMSWVNCFKWIKCCEPISINNDYYQAATPTVLYR